jgi:hypothetical protein
MQAFVVILAQACRKQKEDVMPGDEELREAERVLAAYPEYRWLMGADGVSKQWWSVADVAAQLDLTADVVRAWCQRGEIPGAVLYEKQVGWRMPRSGLVVYFAKLQGWNGASQSAG